MESQYARFQVWNNSGVAFGGLAGDYIDMQCRLLNTTFSTSALSKQDLASPQVFSIAASTLANGAVLSTTSFDASNAGVQAIYQGEFEWQVGISNAATGSVSLYLQTSPDNTTWPDNATGQLIGTLNFTASGSHNGQGKF